jgi:hypothetical protein
MVLDDVFPILNTMVFAFPCFKTIRIYNVFVPKQGTNANTTFFRRYDDSWGVCESKNAM